MSARIVDLNKQKSTFNVAPSALLQRKGAFLPRAETVPPGASGSNRFSRDLSGVPVSRSLGVLLPAARGNLADVPVHYPSPLADQHDARAVTSDDGIHLASRAVSLPRGELDALLAHESVHVAQQINGRRPGAARLMESEAHHLAPAVLAGQPVSPLFHPNPGAVLTETPAEVTAVEAAKKRLVVLNKYVDEWSAREGRRLRTAQERDPRLQQRTKMDEPTLDPTRGKAEISRLADLNRVPLDIKITDDEVRFQVKFQVRFEDASMTSRFGELKTSLREGIRMFWTQRLQGPALGGRQLAIEPEVMLVSPTAGRDQKYWLITVRPTDDNRKVSYPGCTLDQPPGNIPTSVTDPECDGGVMSIPPLHIVRPAVFGHELLHLFGLIDRYYLWLHQVPGKKDDVQLLPSRETGGRPDPLGGQEGKILSEDLTFLFERLGVYEMEENRGLDTLRQLEKRGLTINSVRGEIHRQEEIVSSGGKKPTLFKPRTDFRDKMIKDADNL